MDWRTKGKDRPLRALGLAADSTLRPQGEGQPQGPGLPPPTWISSPLLAIGQWNSNAL